jgi:hypothetical protein
MAGQAKACPTGGERPASLYEGKQKAGPTETDENLRLRAYGIWLTAGRLVCGDYFGYGGLKLDLDLLEVGRANVLSFVGGGVAPAGGARFDDAFHGFAAGQSDLQFSIGQEIGNIFGVRMHGSDLARLDVHGENADVFVFEDDAMGIAGDLDDVLRRRGARGGVEGGRG